MSKDELYKNLIHESNEFGLTISLSSNATNVLWHFIMNMVLYTNSIICTSSFIIWLVIIIMAM